ncbi:Uncharacterized protein BM_BM1548 [Brugia malayi]|uniref:Uncharacterized protein n=1 Tax=Brugia malayi TaxID=6279 RepID=A0A4E9F6S0_BRUMA|nr:Uncharacterized protein BM_BM1548 [Brugia malayi]VIO89741.1 Uncharacterized protein BM_BM1548 [Brugia malayi]
MISFVGWQYFIFELILFIFISNPFYVQCNKDLKELHEADSWGTKFIFILPPNNINKFRTYCYLAGMNKEANITVNIEYNSKSNNTEIIARKKDKFHFKNFYKYDFHNLAMDDIVQEGLHMLKDNRIYVTSSDKISINCHIFDLESVVDLLTVYPVGMGGDYYGFSLPGSSTVTIYLLPLERTNETISETHHISIIEKQNNKLKTIKQNMKAGSLWQFTAYVEKTISVWIRDQLSNTNTTKVTGQRAWNNEIARLMVIVSIRNVSIQGVAKKDFGCFMPTPMIVDRCARLTIPAYYPMNKAFANNILLTAPSNNCPMEKVDIIFAKVDLLPMKWNKSPEPINVNEKFCKKSLAIKSTTTSMNIINYGGNKGMFIHEIPAYSQWINDDIFPVVVPEGSHASLHVILSNYSEKAVRKNVQNGNEEFSNFRFSYSVTSLGPGFWRMRAQHGRKRRYVPIVIIEFNNTSIGYIAAISLPRISPPIFTKYSHIINLKKIKPEATTSLTTTTEEECFVDATATEPIAAPLIVATTKITQGASVNILSNNLFAICIFFIVCAERKQ